MWGRLRAFHRLGFAIDLVVTTKTPPEPEHLAKVRELVRRVDLLPRSRRIFDLVSIYPFQFTSRRILATLPRRHDYDLVFLETAYPVAALDSALVGGSPVVLKMHNDEAVYNMELAAAAKGLARKLFHWSEAIKFKALEALIARRVPAIFFSSDNECAAFARRHPRVHCRFLGGATADDSIHARPRQGKAVLFVGSLFMDNNREAVDWYLAQVHPKLLAVDGYRFLVVGNAAGADPAWLTRLEQTPGVELHRSVPDLDPFYDRAAVFANPMQHGTSIKMKTIEALRNGLPVVSTPCGVMGAGFKDGEELLVARTGDQFAAAIRTLLDDRAQAERLVEAGFALIKRDYDHAARLQRLLGEIGIAVS